MTEAEWLVCEDPKKMLDWLGLGVSERISRLFATACCWRLSHLFTDPRLAAALETCERYADKNADLAEMLKSQSAASAAHSASWEAVRRSESDPHRLFRLSQPSRAVTVAMRIPFSADWTVREVADALVEEARSQAGATEEELRAVRSSFHRLQCHFIRDMFGNPFLPVTLDPSWQTSNVLALAQTIYQERAFERLPILADALLDAGCDSADILSQCRSPGPHVRGCWVIDLLLGKS